MKLHYETIKKQVYEFIINNTRTFIYSQNNELQIGDLINFQIVDDFENIKETATVVKIIDIINDEEITKNNYCIIVFKELK